MKGIFNNILVLAGAFSAVLATPIRRSSSPNRIINFEKINSEAVIEDHFLELDDPCVKNAVALYKIYQYIDEGKMGYACGSDTIYTKYIKSAQRCEDQKFSRFIYPALYQRNYLCGKNNKGDYCNPDAILRNGLTEKKIKNEICNADAGNDCMAKFSVFLNYVDEHALQSFPDEAEVTFENKNEGERDLFKINIKKISNDISMASVDLCKESSEKPDDNKKVSTNGKCGSEDGVCPSGECCSKHGWCGTSSDHCDVSRGCQSEFGQCSGSAKTTTKASTKTKTTKTKKTTTKTKKTTKTTKKATTTKKSKETVKVSTNGKCGPKDGKCPSGYCCSKSGWCGSSDLHCQSGCQSEFGRCD